MSELKTKIRIQKHWREVKELIYPQGPIERGTWYFEVVPSMTYGTAEKPEEDRKSNRSDNHFESAWVVIHLMGEVKGRHEFGSADLSDEQFAEKWLRLVGRAKKVVDALNADPDANPVIVLSKCANCDASALADDYLCETCREANA